jgi:Tol biopolymer transport system component
MFGYALSPDEKRVAINLKTEGRNDIWVHDIERGVRSRFTFVENTDGDPLWSPDGRFIAFATRPNALVSRLHRKPADGSGKEELLTEQTHQMIPDHWSRDGKYLVYDLFTGNTNRDLWLLPMGGPQSAARTAEPYLKAKANIIRGGLSPDSRWMAYASDESAEYRIYVQAVPAGGAKWQISTAGGGDPSWRRDGNEIYFIASDRKLMAVPVDAAGANFRPGTPQPLFELPAQAAYQASADGRRFLVRLPAEGEASVPPIEVLINWPATLRKAEPAP